MIAAVRSGPKGEGLGVSLDLLIGAALISVELYRRPTILTLAVGSSDGDAKQIASLIGDKKLCRAAQRSTQGRVVRVL